MGALDYKLIGFILVGAAVLVLLYRAIRYIRFVPTEAIVIDRLARYNSNGDNKSAWVFAPIYEYWVNNRRLIYTTKWGNQHAPKNWAKNTNSV